MLDDARHLPSHAADGLSFAPNQPAAHSFWPRLRWLASWPESWSEWCQCAWTYSGLSILGLLQSQRPQNRGLAPQHYGWPIGRTPIIDATLRRRGRNLHAEADSLPCRVCLHVVAGYCCLDPDRLRRLIRSIMLVYEISGCPTAPAKRAMSSPRHASKPALKLCEPTIRVSTSRQ